jgi:hypothetical protein
MRHTQTLRNVAPSRSQPNNPRSISQSNPSHMQVNLLRPISRRNLSNFTGIHNSFPPLLAPRQMLQRLTNTLQIRLLPSHRNHRQPNRSIQSLHIHHVEPAECDAVQHDHPQLREMRRTRDHSGYFFCGVKPVHKNPCAHDAFNPVAPTKNHSHHRHQTRNVWSEDAIVNS